MGHHSASGFQMPRFRRGHRQHDRHLAPRQKRTAGPVNRRNLAEQRQHHSHSKTSEPTNGPDDSSRSHRLPTRTLSLPAPTIRAERLYQRSPQGQQLLVDHVSTLPKCADDKAHIHILEFLAIMINLWLLL